MANDYRSFSVQLDQFSKKVGLSVETVTKRVAFDLFSRIIRRTPVDTGRARGSWTIAANIANRRVLPPQPKGVVAPPPAIGVLSIAKGERIIISNNLPYITALEDGHSKQAPAGMVALSIAEVETNTRRLIQDGLRDAGL